MKKRSLKSRRDALRMKTWNCVSEIAKPCGRVELGEPADHGVEVLDVVDHRLPFGMAEAVVDRRAVGVALGAR